MSSSSSFIETHVSLAEEVAKVAKTVDQRLEESLLKTVSSSDPSKGLSLLDVKNHLLLDYLIDCSLVAFSKSAGSKLENSAVVDRLAENRVFLEKIKPIESKLKYQIEKAVKVVDTGTVNADDPLHFKPNPRNLMSKLENNEVDDEEEEEEDEEEEKSDNDNNDGKKTNVYRAPHNVPTFYDRTAEETERDENEKRIKGRMSRSLIEDLKRQHLDTPEEEFNASDSIKNKRIHEYKDRIRYEEENFIRLPVSKKEKHRQKQKFSTVNSIGDEITAFGSNLFADQKSGKKRKAASSKRGSSKNKFKRRK